MSNYVIAILALGIISGIGSLLVFVAFLIKRSSDKKIAKCKKSTIGRVEKIEKMYTGVQTVFDGQQSTWDRVKGGLSTINSFNSTMDFTKRFGNTGKVTGLLDKTVKAGENLYLQFAH